MQSDILSLTMQAIIGEHNTAAEIAVQWPVLGVGPDEEERSRFGFTLPKMWKITHQKFYHQGESGGDGESMPFLWSGFTSLGPAESTSFNETIITCIISHDKSENGVSGTLTNQDVHCSLHCDAQW